MATKRVIAADDVRAARKEGRGEISVPPGTLFTPQARDDAREFGIRLVFADAAGAVDAADTSGASGAVAEKNAAAPPPGVPPFPRSGVAPGASSGTAARVVPGRITLYAGQSPEREFIPASPADSARNGRVGEKKTARGTDRRLGVCMIFLTEDDMRQRSIAEGGELVLSASEKLTPSAMGYIRERRIRVTVDGAGPGGGEKPCEIPAEGTRTDENRSDAERAGQGLTHLDAVNMVAKTHPRIEARGKLDNLMAEIVLTQTLFDPKAKLPPLLKGCLADLKEWVFQTLAAEISGSILPGQSMAGMNPETLRAVSRNPRRYLGLDHLTPDAALGMNIAFLNRLRTQVRETELAVAKAALCRNDIQESLNRLSGAVYVLMLLTRLAESGGGLPEVVLKGG
jgi:ethanolamine utilization cobalamin adenosyltransferase